MGNPPLMQDIRRRKSNESSKRSKERLFKYQEGKPNDIEIQNDWRRNKVVDRKKVKPAEQPSEVTKEKGINTESILVCEKCNNKCTRTETIAKHMKSNHAINEIFKCEHCRENHASKIILKEHMEIHKLEETVKQKIWCNPNFSAKEQNEAFEERKRQDIKNRKDIEKLLKECEQDMRDGIEDDVYSDSDSNE